MNNNTKKMISIQEIKQNLENNQQYQYYKNEYGISFADFDIINLNTESYIKRGKKDIGSYSIMIKNNKVSVSYDLTAKIIRDMH